MADDSDTGNRKRTRPSDAQMRKVLGEVRKLLDTLENEQGTLLDPDEVATQLAAIRARRVTVAPAPQPKVVLEPHDDWSDVELVPLAALGLRVATYEPVFNAGIRTVGLLVKHSLRGTYGAGFGLGPQRSKELSERLAEHGLALANDCSEVPVAHIIDRGQRTLVWHWTSEAQHEFANALGLKVLGDVSRLTVERIRTAPFGARTTVGPHPSIRTMSSDDPNDVRYVVDQLNDLLRLYDMPMIER